jgi:ADP-ribosyl-[dinitrogen reductase] hydrolase
VAYGRRGAITDDTQMTLFTAKALTANAPADRLPGAACDLSALAAHPGGARALRYRAARGSGAAQEARPGNTCLSALVATRRGALGTVATPINDSKGCGGVMRAAPAGLV